MPARVVYLAAMTNPAYPPPPPYQSQAAAAPVAPPGSVNGAFFIYVLAALVSLVGIILTLTSSVWADAIAANVTTTSGTNVHTLVNTVKITSAVFGVIFLALYLFFAFKMRAGRNWARIVLTVLSALSIISALTTTTTAVTVNGHVYKSTSTQFVGWIGVVLAIVAIVLMFLPASNAYFTASKAARQRV
jgi:hypothetical protein